MQKRVYHATSHTVPIKITSYAGNYIYEKESTTESLQFFSHPEGYVEKKGSSFDYVYQYKDHLKNVRLSYSDSNNDGSIDAATEIISEKNYYPFGLTHKGYNNVISGNSNAAADKFGFGGKELQDELGLEWMDFHARNYDASLGRWMNVDPLAEKSPDWTPFRYAYNNPVKYFDLDGKIERDAKTGKVKVTGIEKRTTTYVGNGQVDYEVSGNYGYITANDGKTKLKVFNVDQASLNLTGERNWVDASDNPTIATNCYGNTITDGEYVVEANNDAVGNFLKADGYDEIKDFKGYKAQAGDIFLLREGHAMEVVGLDKDGKAIFESHWAGDLPVRGSFRSVNFYNEDNISQKRNTSNTYIFRPTQGDVYVDENGNKQTKEKVVAEKNKYPSEKID
jgi:RHS repeat-associated protein